MQVIFQSCDTNSSHMRDLSVERVRFALRRITGLVSWARVQFSDVNGPRGGVDKRCQVELKTDGAAKVVITSLAHDWQAALNSSLTRATRVLTRTLKRSQKHQKDRTAKLLPPTENNQEN